MLEGSPPFGASGPQWRTEVSSPIEGLGRGGRGGRKRWKVVSSKKGPLSFGCWCGLRTGERPTWIWSQFEVFLSHMTEISWRRLLLLSLRLLPSFLSSFSCTYIFVLLMMLLIEGVESSGKGGEGEKYTTHNVWIDGQGDTETNAKTSSHTIAAAVAVRSACYRFESYWEELQPNEMMIFLMLVAELDQTMKFVFAVLESHQRWIIWF